MYVQIERVGAQEKFRFTFHLHAVIYLNGLHGTRLSMEEEKLTKALVLEKRTNQTICVSGEYESVEIDGCTGCFIYIMKEMDAVHVRHTSETTIFICKAQISSATYCNSVRITAYAENISVSKCQDLDLFLYVANPPVLSDGSFKIRLGPYNAAVKSVVPRGQNSWNTPICQTGATFSLIDPSDFLPFVIPFGEEPEGILSPLPPSYAKALAWREQIAEERRQLVLDFCKKVPSCADAIQERISAAFKEHLASSRHGDQLKQLQETEYL